MNEVMDFGKNIIGGADGPTSVFLASKLSPQMMIVSIIIGLLLCFWGLKLARVLIVICGFLTGLSIGIGIALAFHTHGITFVIIMAACALAVALLSIILYKFGVFCMVFFETLALAVSLLGISGGITFALEPGSHEMIAGAAALAAAVVLAALAVKFVEPMLIIVTALTGGISAGSQLLAIAGLDTKPWMGYALGAVLAVLGMVVQFKIFKSHPGKSARKQKSYGKTSKGKAAVESEVEKARTILEEDEEE